MNVSRRLAIGLTLTACIGAAALAAAVRAADWLDVSIQPADAGTLLVLAGDPVRAVAAARLHGAGLADEIVLSRPAPTHGQRRLAELGVDWPGSAQLSHEVLLALGVPGDAVRTTRNVAVSTWEEAQNVREELDPGQSIIVVTSPLHTRRARWIFRDVLPGRNVTVVSGDGGIPVSPWWTDQETAIQVVLEYAKLLHYAVGGRFGSGPGTEAQR